MIIRPAIEDDIPALLEILNQAIRDLDAIWIEREDTSDDRARWFSERRRMNFPVFVAEDESGKVVGYGSYGTYREREGYRATAEHSVYVLPAGQGRGIGKALLTRLIEQARKDGLHAMVAVIDADNQLSIEMHRKFGFTGGERMPQVGQKKGRWRDLVQMVKLLDARAHP